MFGSVVLEVVLGLGFTFAALSLACSAFVELLESIRSQRGKQLAIFIERMLGAELKLRFYQHALIRSLSKPGRLPSYLPAHSFARVTFDLLGIDANWQRSALDQLPGEMGQVLRVLIQDTADPEQARLRLEQWFESTMERCAGAFRRRMRWTAFGSALVMTALLNVDALEISSALYADAHLRLSMLAQPDTDSQIPIARQLADRGPSVLSIPIESGTLPLGWENSRLALRAQFADRPWSNPAFWFGPVLSKVLGLIVTALAASLAAGLWFDLLRWCTRVHANGASKSAATWSQ